MSVWVGLAAFMGSALLSGVLVHLSIRAAHRWELYDRPDGERKTQASPVPKVGGIAVAIAFTVAFLVAVSVFGQAETLALLAGVLAPALGVALLGFADDLRMLSPWVRLGVQTVLAIAVWAAGTRVEFTGASAVDLAVTVAWIVGLTNAMNLLDNSDGLAAATTLVSSLGAGAIAMVYGQYFVSGFALALAGVAAGFLWHNWHPASVYLGDAGAYFLGFLLAVVTIRLRPSGLALPWSAVIPLLLVAVPLLDTVFVVTRRVRAGRHPFQPGRDHLSHALQDRGLHVTRAVAVLQVVLVASVGAALTLAVAFPGDVAP